MPKSKIRSKSIQSHYNPNGGIIVSTSIKQAMFGKRARPVPGSKHRIKKYSSFRGNLVTPYNRRSFIDAQSEAFRDRYIENVIIDRDKIANQEGKDEDEIRVEIDKFNEEQLSDEHLIMMGERFGRFQSNKASKHLKAFLKGQKQYKYHKNSFPVITENFLNSTKSVKDIIKVEDNEKANSRGSDEGADNPAVPGNNEDGNDQTI